MVGVEKGRHYAALLNTNNPTQPGGSTHVVLSHQKLLQVPVLDPLDPRHCQARGFGARGVKPVDSRLGPEDADLEQWGAQSRSALS